MVAATLKRKIKLSRSFSKADTHHMKTALGLAARGLGRVWPNPAVGCVLVNKGHVVGRGWTQPGGRPHAEYEALWRAGANAKGATAYVSLEPCFHEGQTPACARLLYDAGVKRVVIATKDPDTRTNGKSVKMLAKLGVTVETGLLGKAARALNEGYFKRTKYNRPMVTLKLATSLDGKIAAEEGKQTWLTGEIAQKYSHRLRATHDAILTGVGTVVADDPLLTCRIEGLSEFSPVRYVLDTNLRIPPKSRLLQKEEEAPVVLITEEEKIPKQLQRLNFDTKETININKLERVLETISNRGITRLLVEGGSRVNASFLASGLVDHICWFRADDQVLGAEAVPAFFERQARTFQDLPGYYKVRTRQAGTDSLEFVERLD